MQLSSRFTVAVHVLLCIEAFKNDYKVTSDLLASSVNVNPVVIRRLLQQLKKAHLINVIEKPLGKITLLDVYNAVEGGSFSISMKALIPFALLVKISIRFWM